MDLEQGAKDVWTAVFVGRCIRGECLDPIPHASKFVRGCAAVADKAASEWTDEMRKRMEATPSAPSEPYVYPPVAR